MISVSERQERMIVLIKSGIRRGHKRGGPAWLYTQLLSTSGKPGYRIVPMLAYLSTNERSMCFCKTNELKSSAFPSMGTGRLQNFEAFQSESNDDHQRLCPLCALFMRELQECIGICFKIAWARPLARTLNTATIFNQNPYSQLNKYT